MDLPKAKQAVKAVWSKLAESCVVCRKHLRIDDTPAEIHHIVDGGRKLSHWMVIPLCPIHHRQGTFEHPCRHSVIGQHGGLDIFEHKYCTEQYSLDEAQEWIGHYYSNNYQPDGLLSDEQALQELDTESRADSERVGGSGNSVPSKDAEMESDTGDEFLGAKTVQRFITPVRISVHHYRHRLCDADAPSIKAALDEIVHTGVLRDDSTRKIHEIGQKQFKIRPVKRKKRSSKSTC